MILSTASLQFGIHNRVFVRSTRPLHLEALHFFRQNRVPGTPSVSTTPLSALQVPGCRCALTPSNLGIFFPSWFGPMSSQLDGHIRRLIDALDRCNKARCLVCATARRLRKYIAQTRLLPPNIFISIGGCPRKTRLPSHNISRPRVVGGRISSSWCCSANGKQTWGTRWDPGRINSSCAHYARLSTTVDIVHHTVVTGRDAATITTSQISKRALVNSLDHLGQPFHARQLDHHHHALSLPP